MTDSQKHGFLDVIQVHRLLKHNAGAGIGPATPARREVWQRLTVPGVWSKWWFAENIPELSDGRRRGTGPQNHCAHGAQVTLVETLDWHPFHCSTCGITLPVPDAPQIVTTRSVTKAPGGGTLLAM